MKARYLRPNELETVIVAVHECALKEPTSRSGWEQGCSKSRDL